MQQEEPEPLSRETIDELLDGTITVDKLSEIAIDDITDNVRLRNVYERSEASNLAEFLKLGKKRTSIRNYGKKTELILRQSLVNLFAGNPLTKSPLSKFQIAHDKLLCELANSRRIRKTEWNVIRKDLQNTKFADYQISSVAAELDLDWPLSAKSEVSSKKIADFLDMSMTQILEIRGFGRKKLLDYLKCAVYLHQCLKEGIEPEEDLDIPEIVRLILKHGRLTQREEQVLRLRFGIQGERRHTLTEIKEFYDITRERVRQIEAKALKKLRMSRYFKPLPELLVENRLSVWAQLCDSDKLRKQEWMEPLEDCLGFEYQIALEICDSTGNRNPNTSVLANWLDTHFYHDETYWYKSDPDSTTVVKNREKISLDLLEFINQL